MPHAAVSGCCLSCAVPAPAPCNLTHPYAPTCSPHPLQPSPSSCTPSMPACTLCSTPRCAPPCGATSAKKQAAARRGSSSATARRSGDGRLRRCARRSMLQALVAMLLSSLRCLPSVYLHCHLAATPLHWPAILPMQIQQFSCSAVPAAFMFYFILQTPAIHVPKSSRSFQNCLACRNALMASLERSKQEGPRMPSLQLLLPRCCHRRCRRWAGMGRPAA